MSVFEKESSIKCQTSCTVALNLLDKCLQQVLETTHQQGILVLVMDVECRTAYVSPFDYVLYADLVKVLRFHQIQQRMDEPFSNPAGAAI